MKFEHPNADTYVAFDRKNTKLVSFVRSGDRWLLRPHEDLDVEYLQQIIVRFKSEALKEYIRPDFAGNIQKILRDHHIEVFYSDECVYPDGTPAGPNEHATWGMKDEYGTLTFDSLVDPERKDGAELASAVFWYLWAWHYVDIAIAERCANGYAACYKETKTI